MPATQPSQTPRPPQRLPSPAGAAARKFAGKLPMAPLSEQSPEELAVRAQAGGGPALACFGELVKRFEVRLYNFLLKRTRSRSDAEELTQEAFTRAWERITSYDPAWKFSTWLYTIGSRLAVSKHRRQGRESAWSTFDRAGPEGADQLQVQDDRRLGNRLWSLAEEELSSDQQTALWLRYAEDMSIGEIAKVMGKTQVGIRVSLFRARQALAKRANAEGWLPSVHVQSHEGSGERAGEVARG